MVKGFIAATGMGAALLVCHPASAATVTAAGVDGSATFASPLTAQAGGQFAGFLSATGPFEHSYFFTADGPTVEINATPNNLQPAYGFLDLSYLVRDVTNNAVVANFASAPAVLSFAAVAGVQYAVDVNGTANGGLGGNYTGNIAVTPIPATLALFGVALGGLGYAGLRKRATA